MWRTLRETGRSRSTTDPPKLSVLRISCTEAAEIAKLKPAIEKTATCSRGRLSLGIRLELFGCVIANLLAVAAGKSLRHNYQSRKTFPRCPKLDRRNPCESLRQACRKSPKSPRPAPARVLALL